MPTIRFKLSLICIIFCLLYAGPGFSAQQIYPNVTAMSADTLVVGDTYTTQGYEIPGIGGGDYLVVAGDSSDSYVNISVNGGADTAILQHNGKIDIRQAGAIPGTDSTNNIQGVIDYLATIGGGAVYISPGIYKTTSPLVVSSGYIYITGAGMSSEIQPQDDYGDVILFQGDSGKKIARVGMSDLYINIEEARTNGAILRLSEVIFGDFSNLWFSNGFVGIKLEAAGQVQFKGLYHNNYNIAGQSSTNRRLIWVTAPTGGGISFSDFNIRGKSKKAFFDTAIEINAVDGIWFDNGHIQGSGVANILINANTPGKDTFLNYIFFNNVMSDICFGDGIRYAGNSITTGSNHFFSNSSIAGGNKGQNGINVSSEAAFSEIFFNNINVKSFRQRGLYVQSDKWRKVTFTGFGFTGNSMSEANMYPHIEFADGAGYTKFSGGYAGGKASTYQNQDGQASYGMVLSENSTNILVDNTDLTNNGIGSVSGSGDTSCTFSNILTDTALVLESTAVLTIPKDRKFVVLRGTSTITSIQPHKIGEVVVLRFQKGGLTVVDGNNLLMNGNFVSTGLDTLTLISDGTNWTEVSRSTN